MSSLLGYKLLEDKDHILLSFISPAVNRPCMSEVLKLKKNQQMLFLNLYIELSRREEFFIVWLLCIWFKYFVKFRKVRIYILSCKIIQKTDWKIIILWASCKWQLWFGIECKENQWGQLTSHVIQARGFRTTGGSIVC